MAGLFVQYSKKPVNDAPSSCGPSLNASSTVRKASDCTSLGRS